MGSPGGSSGATVRQGSGSHARRVAFHHGKGTHGSPSEHSPKHSERMFNIPTIYIMWLAGPPKAAQARGLPTELATAEAIRADWRPTGRCAMQEDCTANLTEGRQALEGPSCALQGCEAFSIAPRSTRHPTPTDVWARGQPVDHGDGLVWKRSGCCAERWPCVPQRPPEVDQRRVRPCVDESL